MVNDTEKALAQAQSAVDLAAQKLKAANQRFVEAQHAYWRDKHNITIGTIIEDEDGEQMIVRDLPVVSFAHSFSKPKYAMVSVRRKSDGEWSSQVKGFYYRPYKIVE